MFMTNGLHGPSKFPLEREACVQGRRGGRVGRASNLGERERAGRPPFRLREISPSLPNLDARLLTRLFWVEEMGQVKVKLNPKLAIGPSSNFEAKFSCFYSRYHQSDADYPPPDQTGLRILDLE